MVNTDTHRRSGSVLPTLIGIVRNWKRSLSQPPAGRSTQRPVPNCWKTQSSRCVVAGGACRYMSGYIQRLVYVMPQEKQQHAKQLAGLRVSIRQELEASIGKPLPPDVTTLQAKVCSPTMLLCRPWWTRFRSRHWRLSWRMRPTWRACLTCAKSCRNSARRWTSSGRTSCSSRSSSRPWLSSTRCVNVWYLVPVRMMSFSQALVHESKGLARRLWRLSPTRALRGKLLLPPSADMGDLQGRVQTLQQEAVEKDKRIDRLTRQLTILQQTATVGPNVRVSVCCCGGIHAILHRDPRRDVRRRCCLPWASCSRGRRRPTILVDSNSRFPVQANARSAMSTHVAVVKCSVS